jgi:RNA polymerase sigma-70 factor (ECF subfamily)
MTGVFAPLVYYWCLRAGLQPADAEDVVQEVFRTVARRIADFRRNGHCGAFRAWLRTITRHKIGDFVRSQRRRGECLRDPTDERLWADDPPDSQSTGLDAELPMPEETRLLYSSVLAVVQGEFEEKTWRAFYRVVVDEVPPKSVAEELGMSVNSVYLAKARVLRRVRDELSDAL